MSFKDFLGFEKFLTPALVKIVYWIGLAAIAISAIGTFFAAFTTYGGIRQIFAAILILVVGSIFWRVICEGIMLTFKMYDRMNDIRDRLPRN